MAASLCHGLIRGIRTNHPTRNMAQLRRPVSSAAAEIEDPFIGRKASGKGVTGEVLVPQIGLYLPRYDPLTSEFRQSVVPFLASVLTALQAPVQLHPTWEVQVPIDLAVAVPHLESDGIFNPITHFVVQEASVSDGR